MSSVKEAFGSNTSITITSVASLTNNSQAGSAVVDNTSNLYLDAQVVAIIKTASASTSSTGYCNIYAYASIDGGSNYSDAVTGADATQTLTVPPNLRLIGVMNCVANSTTYVSSAFSVAAAFGGTLPPKWGIVIENKTGATLAASGSSASYVGVYGTIA
jgi:hypothetical protein